MNQRLEGCVSIAIAPPRLDIQRVLAKHPARRTRTKSVSDTSAAPIAPLPTIRRARGSLMPVSLPAADVVSAKPMRSGPSAETGTVYVEGHGPDQQRHEHDVRQAERLDRPRQPRDGSAGSEDRDDDHQAHRTV